jgi:hypothetical protein
MFRPGCLHSSSQPSTAARSNRTYRPNRTHGIAPERVDSRIHDTGTRSHSATSRASRSLSFTVIPLAGLFADIEQGG